MLDTKSQQTEPYGANVGSFKKYSLVSHWQPRKSFEESTESDSKLLGSLNLKSVASVSG